MVDIALEAHVSAGVQGFLTELTTAINTPSVRARCTHIRAADIARSVAG